MKGLKIFLLKNGEKTENFFFICFTTLSSSDNKINLGGNLTHENTSCLYIVKKAYYHVRHGSGTVQYDTYIKRLKKDGLRAENERAKSRIIRKVLTFIYH